MGKGARTRKNHADAKEKTDSILSNPEVRKAINKEINRRFVESHERFFDDEISTILWVLHETFGFGKERLRRYYDQYGVLWQQMRDYYEMSDDDMPFLTTRRLKEIGVDLEEWNKEVSTNGCG